MTLKLAAAVAAAWLCAGAAGAADFVTVTLDTTADVSAEVAWKKLRGFCEIGTWMKLPCFIASGRDGEAGAVRRVNGRLDELIVASTALSYTYGQPKSPTDYHGTVEARPIDRNHARLIYTVVYDADALPNPTPEGKAAERDLRVKRFTAVLAAMKASAEGR